MIGVCSDVLCLLTRLLSMNRRTMTGIITYLLLFFKLMALVKKYRPS